MSNSQSSGRLVKEPPDINVGAGAGDVESSPPVKPQSLLTSEQPTIISNRPPIAVPGLSDSVYRIMEGRIMPGDHLGHFELVECVGGGGMGLVFRAVDTRLARTVALKILSPDQAADPETLQRFQNEAQSAARLDHENIARVHYVGEDRGINFIAFEFVEGENIRKMLERKGPLPLGEAVSYTLQVAEALAHADQRNVVHRDIKPSNVLITPSGRVKLIDMGLARFRRADPAGADLTASGVTLGTFDYIAPEQARDPRNADIRSDIYSLGCTFYFMLAGRPPFPEGTVLQKLLQHQADPPPDLRQFRPDLPDEANHILQKMMAKEPHRRYLNPGELAADLVLLAEQVGLRPVSPSGTMWMPIPPPKVTFLHRNLPWIASIAAFVCIVIVLHVFWKISSPAEQTPSALLFGPEEFVSQLPQPNRYESETKSAEAETKPSTNNSAAAPQNPAQNAASGSPSAAETSAAKAEPELSGPPQHLPPAANNTVTTSESSAKPVPPPVLSAGAGGESSAAQLSLDSTRSGVTVDDGDYYALTLGAVPFETNGTMRKTPTASTSPAESVENAPPTEVAKQNGLLVVSNLASGENQFTSLAAACTAAHNGDVIELRYSGLREERPIRLANLRVTIRAGKGYQPIILFRPNETDPVKYPRSMFSLTAGRLTISNLAFQFVVPREIPADNWSLLEIRGGQTVRLEKSTITIANAADQLTAYHQDVACFRVGAAPGAEAVVAGANHTAPPLATIELSDCFVRGEAVFLAVEDLQPLHLAWDNGLLVTTERLLSAAGGAQSPKPDEMLRIDLRHVTVVARGGLARLASTQAAPYQFTVQINCTDNIFMTSPANALIEQEVIGPLENARRQMVWNGDHNFYQDTNLFWTIRSLDAQPASDTLNFEGWRKYWGASRENQPFAGHIEWNNLPGLDRPVHAQTPGDYALNAAAVENPAIGATSDGRNVGAQIENLMAPPPDSAPAKP